MKKSHTEQGFSLPSPPLHPDTLLTPEQCAAWLQVDRRQLQRAGVPHVVVSHKIRRYRVRDVLAWLDRQVSSPEGGQARFLVR